MSISTGKPIESGSTATPTTTTSVKHDKAVLDNIVAELTKKLGEMKIGETHIMVTLVDDLDKTRIYTGGEKDDKRLRAWVHFDPFHTIMTIDETESGKFRVSISQNYFRQLFGKDFDGIKIFKHMQEIVVEVFGQNGIPFESAGTDGEKEPNLAFRIIDFSTEIIDDEERAKRKRESENAAYYAEMQKRKAEFGRK